MKQIYYTRFESPFCPITLAGNEDGLMHLHLHTLDGKRTFAIKKDWIENDEFFLDVVNQIGEYFEGSRKRFDVKLNLDGTVYQKRVWAALQSIPFGECRSYKEMAVSISNERASRAVGAANGKNPIPLIIPCHRVIGSNGNLTGFAHGLTIKGKLIEFEQKVCMN